MLRLTLLAATALLGVQTQAATLVTDVVGWTATATAAQTHQAVASKRFTALLVDGEGRVVATGDAASLADRAAALGEPVEQVSGDGHFLMPDIIDAHGHFTSLGFDALRLNITGLRSLGETLEAIRARVATDTGGGWITGGRWNHELWPVSRFPTAADLEDITDRPIWLRRVDGHGAVTRQNRMDEPARGWRPEDALTLEQTLRGFTLDAAWAARQEDTLGSLEPGKWADFVLLKQNPFETAPEDLWKMEIAETWVNGERVFAAP